MTRKGFGEMAITACMASPIFNSLFGIGLPVLIKLLRNRKTNPDYVVYFSLYKDNDKMNFLPVSVLHLTLIAA
jgi:Ca2+/Na+ antiporter